MKRVGHSMKCKRWSRFCQILLNPRMLVLAENLRLFFLVANLASVHQQWRDEKLDADRCPLCHPLLSLVGKRIFQS